MINDLHTQPCIFTFFLCKTTYKNTITTWAIKPNLTKLLPRKVESICVPLKWLNRWPENVETTACNINSANLCSSALKLLGQLLNPALVPTFENKYDNTICHRAILKFQHENISKAQTWIWHIHTLNKIKSFFQCMTLSFSYTFLNTRYFSYIISKWKYNF